MKKPRRRSYDCSTYNCVNAVAFWHGTAIVTCTSNYAGAAPESFITKVVKCRKVENQCANGIRSDVSKLWAERICLINLLSPFAEKSDGGRYFHGASMLL